MTTNKYIAYSTTLVMDHYRLLQSQQWCKACGAKHDGSFASEVFVVFFDKDKPHAMRSLPLRTVLQRYSMFMGIVPELCRKYLPDIPTKLELVPAKAPNIETCYKCKSFNQWLTNIPDWTPSPDMMPIEWEELPVQQKEEIRNPKAAHKTRRARMKAKAAARPLSMKGLMSVLGGK